MLTGKRILLGVCGSIAAYKAVILTRLLVKSGAEVKVVMTPSANDFITPLTLSTVSKNPVISNFTTRETGEWNNHVDLGSWADLVLIAPATASTMARLANGHCTTLLDAVYLSATCPVFFAPAMDLDMLQHPATKNNIQKLISYGNTILEPGFGELASGLIGQGRMAEPEEIVVHLENYFNQHLLLQGKRALVTAGPTYEAIDPVRFIGNNSSGKMGFAIAEILAERGANVTLVTGPTTLQINHSGINLLRVTSSDEMYHQCISAFPTSEITVLSAAVADYKPITVADQKIKKKEGSLTIELTKTKDIAAELGKQKKSGQIIVGFALETEDEIANAEKKIRAKNFDLIVLNSLRDQGAGFGHDTNKVTLIDQSLIKTEFNLKTKKEVAIDIVNAICSLSNANA